MANINRINKCNHFRKIPKRFGIKYIYRTVQQIIKGKVAISSFFKFQLLERTKKN